MARRAGPWRYGLGAVLLALAALAACTAERAPVRVGTTPAGTLPPLQPLIDAAPAGSLLRLAPGTYAGPARIAKPLQLDGGGQATVHGGGQGTVLAIAGRDVTVRGLRITASGESHDQVDAGLLVEGDHHHIEDNRIDDVLFGLHLRQATRVVVRGNRVTGKDLPLGLRGDAIRIWNSRAGRIEDNDFERARDLTLSGSPDNALRNNRFRDGRYGLHIIFSPRLQIEGNELSHTGTGIVVLYSPGLVLSGNRIAHALEGGGAGIVFKESHDALVEGNTVLHCAAGLKVDAAPEPSGVLTVRGNRFAHNLVGLFFYGDAGGHRFIDNRFEKNLVPVQLSAPGAGSGNHYRGNQWDDYQGFDRNGDGIGDTPHEIWLFADRIWLETPAATFFRNSPLLELLDFLERLAPFSAPYRVLRDESPRVP